MSLVPTEQGTEMAQYRHRMLRRREKCLVRVAYEIPFLSQQLQKWRGFEASRLEYTAALSQKVSVLNQQCS